MPGRTYVGNSLEFTYRIYDPRLGRFLSVDPIGKKFAWNSPYAFAENKLGLGIELEGLELLPFQSSMFQMQYNGKAGKLEVKIVSENIPEAIKTPDGRLKTNRGGLGTEGHDEPVPNDGHNLTDKNFHTEPDPFLYGDARDMESMPDLPQSSSTKAIQQEEAEQSPIVKGLTAVGDVLRNMLNVLHEPQWEAGNLEYNQRVAFYTATNAYNEVAPQVEAGIPQGKIAQYKADVINYVTDGTVPLGDVVTPKSDGTIRVSYSPQQASYAQQVIKAGNAIIGKIPDAKVTSGQKTYNDQVKPGTN